MRSSALGSILSIAVLSVSVAMAGCGAQTSDQERVTEDLKNLLSGHPERITSGTPFTTFGGGDAGHPTAIECVRGRNAVLGDVGPTRPTWGCRVKYRDGRRT